MGLLQKMVDSVHTSAQCQYMGGHPDWGTSGKGTLEVNNDKVNFKSGLLGIGGFQIPIKDVKGCSLFLWSWHYIHLQSGRENPHLEAIIHSFLTSHIRCILGHTRFVLNLLHLS